MLKNTYIDEYIDYFVMRRFSDWVTLLIRRKEKFISFEFEKPKRLIGFRELRFFANITCKGVTRSKNM